MPFCLYLCRLSPCDVRLLNFLVKVIHFWGIHFCGCCKKFIVDFKLTRVNLQPLLLLLLWFFWVFKFWLYYFLHSLTINFFLLRKYFFTRVLLIRIFYCERIFVFIILIKMKNFLFFFPLKISLKKKKKMGRKIFHWFHTVEESCFTITFNYFDLVDNEKFIIQRYFNAHLRNF